MKSCKYCKEHKPLEEFYRDKKRGLYSARCKTCHGLAHRTCVFCGNIFLSSGARACSTACADKFRPQTFHNCVQCGDIFGPVDRLSRKFCSYKCKSQNQRGATPWNKGKAAPSLYRSETRQCLVCPTKFRATSDYKHKRQLYCSHRCYLKNRRVSAPERMVGDWMASRGIVALPQYRVGRWTIDYFVESIGLVVEVDGAYWHSMKPAQDRDRRKNEEWSRRGWAVLRLDAEAVSQNVERACAPILSSFTGKAARLQATGQTFEEVSAARAVSPPVLAAANG